MNTKALAEYQQRVASGEVIPATRKNPLEKHRENPKSRALAISAKCWDCTCGQRQEIKLCPMTDCALYVFRPYK